MTLSYVSFRDALYAIRDWVDIDYPVWVRRVRMVKDDGKCTWLPEPGRFQILINSDLHEGLQVDTLAHEYAHVLAWWEEEQEDGDHGPRWAHWYQRLYQEVIER